MSDFSVEPREDTDKLWPPLFKFLMLPVFLVYKTLVLSVRVQAKLVQIQCWLLAIDSTVELRESKYWKWFDAVSLPLPKVKVKWWKRDK